MAVIVRLAGLDVKEDEIEEAMRNKDVEHINGWFLLLFFVVEVNLVISDFVLFFVHVWLFDLTVIVLFPLLLCCYCCFCLYLITSIISTSSVGGSSEMPMQPGAEKPPPSWDSGRTGRSACPQGTAGSTLLSFLF